MQILREQTPWGRGGQGEMFRRKGLKNVQQCSTILISRYIYIYTYDVCVCLCVCVDTFAILVFVLFEFVLFIVDFVYNITRMRVKYVTSVYLLILYLCLIRLLFINVCILLHKINRGIGEMLKLVYCNTRIY